jgi:allantoinase
MRRAFRSLRVLSDGELTPRTVVVENGVIIALEPYSASLHTGTPVEDVGELVLMAGLTDVHVHVNEPGRTEWEGFATATAAAAAGGVTTLIDMPLNSTPVTTTAEAFETKLASAEGALAVDVGYWGGLIPEHIDELPGLLSSGVLGIKAFLVHSGIEDFPNVTAADVDRAAPLLAPTGLPLLAHCELDVSGSKRPEGSDPRSYRAYLASRPGQWELDAIALMLERCRRTGMRAHVVHLSCADALPMLREAKAEGLPVTVETCPHYLVLDAEVIPDGDTKFKCAPPIRERENRERLWQGLADGTIDFVATDHSPCPPELKRLDDGDFTKAWGGIASIQFLLPLLWTEAHSRGFGLADLERWVCLRPARFAGLGHRKGRLAVGYQADLVAWDPDAEAVISPETIVYRHKITPYGGRTWHGAVRGTWLAGEPASTAGPTGVRRGRSLLRETRLFDALDIDSARSLLKTCCASDRWADKMLGRRPFGDFRRLARAAGEVWESLGWEDWSQAFSGHPRIGEKFKNNREQAGVQTATAQTLNRLAAANEAYETKFGFVFLVFATGKTADQMLTLLEERLNRNRDEEWLEAAAQHHKITLFRLAQIEAKAAAREQP